MTKIIFDFINRVTKGVSGLSKADQHSREHPYIPRLLVLFLQLLYGESEASRRYRGWFFYSQVLCLQKETGHETDQLSSALNIFSPCLLRTFDSRKKSKA